VVIFAQRRSAGQRKGPAVAGGEKTSCGCGKTWRNHHFASRRKRFPRGLQSLGLALSPFVLHWQKGSPHGELFFANSRSKFSSVHLAKTHIAERWRFRHLEAAFVNANLISYSYSLFGAQNEHSGAVQSAQNEHSGLNPILCPEQALDMPISA